MLYLLYFQLRVIRAFRSNLEDLEERRSVHSLRSSRSHTGAPGHQLSLLHPLLMARSPTSVMPHNLPDISFIDEDPAPLTGGRTSRNGVNLNTDLSKPVQETRI